MASEHTRIGSYRIERELGRGGMGVVHLGYDDRLDRRVAIKELPESFARDPDLLARFEREARTLAQLNHPNVTAIHGIEEHEGRQFLVLEYVEGETLQQRLARGPMPVDEALAVAVQIAAGVAAAHDAGVIHRDLKPGNVIVTPEGRATVLDFGLARTGDTDATASDAHAPTIASPAMNSPTLAGVILGTAAYMSPEQARGRPVDRRTDVWSFGVVLYEMLTATRPFDGETVSDCIAAVLQRDLDFDALPAGTPAPVRSVLEQCLERDRDVRRRDVGDVGAELDRIRRGQFTSHGMSERASSRTPWIVTGLAVVLALAVIGWATTRDPAGPVQDRSPIVAEINTAPGTELALTLGNPSVPSVSPDGRWLVYGLNVRGEPRQLHLRDLTTGRTHALEGTGGAQYPFWSPDSRSIGFFDPMEGLFRVERDGGPPRLLTADSRHGKGGLWLSDGQIVYAPGARSALFVVDAEGGEPSRLTTLDEERGDLSHRHPRWLPGEESFLYFVRGAGTTAEDEPGQIRARRRDGSVDRLLVESSGNGAYHDGHLLYVVDGDLVARPFDAEALAFLGEARTVVEDVLLLRTASLAVFDVSRSGALTYVTSNIRPQRERLTWYDRTGTPLETPLQGLDVESFRLIGDGSRITVNLVGIEEGETIRSVIDLTTGTERRLEESMSSGGLVIVSHDGTRFAHVRDTDEGDQILVSQVDTYAEPIEIGRVGAEEFFGAFPQSWSADDRWVHVRLARKSGDAQSPLNRRYAADGSGTFEDLELVEGAGSVHPSPDGRWYAYRVRNRMELHVHVAPVDAPGDAVRVTHEPGAGIRWRADGQELFIRQLNGTLVVVDTSADSPLEFGRPRALFDIDFPGSSRSFYDVSPDGERILVLEPEISDDFGTFTLMTDWRASVGW